MSGLLRKDRKERVRVQLVELAQTQGIITYNNILDMLPEAERDISLLDEIMEHLMDSGIEVVASTDMEIRLPDDLSWEPNSLSPDIYIADFTSEFLKLLSLKPSEIFNLTPDKFELLICNRLVAMGYDIHRATDNANAKDGGIDIVAYLPQMALTGLVAVQVKHHRSETIKTGVKVVRELSGVISGRPSFSSGLIVTNTAFTKDAWEEKKFMSKNIALRDWVDLIKWIKNDFTGERIFRELPENIPINSKINLARSRFSKI